MNFVYNFSVVQFILFVFFIGINLVAFLFYVGDKFLAISGSRRVRERTLLILALVGGSLGALCGMYVFRHKTSKVSFKIWAWLILVAQMIVGLLIANAFGMIAFTLVS